MELIINFLKTNWLTIVFGLIGAILSIYFYYKSKKSAKPVYQISSMRLLGKKENNLPKEVQVLFEGEEVDRLTNTKIVFWNAGNDVLKGEDIVNEAPILIQFNEGGNILSHKILKRNRVENNIQIENYSDLTNELKISFKYLNPNDGAVIEIIHDSEKIHPYIDGTIMGIEKGVQNLGEIRGTKYIRIGWPMDYIVDFLLPNGKEIFYKFITYIFIFALFLFSIFIAGLTLYDAFIKSNVDISILVTGFIGSVLNLLISIYLFLFFIKPRKYPKNLQL